MTFFNSSLKSLMFMKSQSPSQDSSHNERLATRDLKITLGSQVDGMGRFLNSRIACTSEPNPLPFSGNISGVALSSDKNATRREQYEEIKEDRSAPNWPLNSDNERESESVTGRLCEDAEHGVIADSAEHSRPIREPGSALELPRRRRLFERLKTNRTGYWDILTVFRSGVGKSVSQSTANSEAVELSVV